MASPTHCNALGNTGSHQITYCGSPEVMWYRGSKQFVKSLKNKELVIFRERILADTPLTLREIGEIYGITRERVRQIEEIVKKKIRAYLKMKFKDLRETRIGS